MGRHGPISRFDSTFRGETTVSKTTQESGYLCELRGMAVAGTFGQTASRLRELMQASALFLLVADRPGGIRVT